MGLIHLKIWMKHHYRRYYDYNPIRERLSHMIWLEDLIKYIFQKRSGLELHPEDVYKALEDEYTLSEVKEAFNRLVQGGFLKRLPNGSYIRNIERTEVRLVKNGSEYLVIKVPGNVIIYRSRRVEKALEVYKKELNKGAEAL